MEKRKGMKYNPTIPRLVYVEAVLMPNGALFSDGHYIGSSGDIHCVANIINVWKDSISIEKLPTERTHEE